jgi:glutamate-1-semialdehyde 2,1-aminomutase
MTEQSRLTRRATESLAGGVSAGWNAFAESGPRFISRAEGSHLWDVDGNEYIDYVVGWGSLILGHQPPAVRVAVEAAFDEGFGFQYETEANISLSELLVSLVPSAERVRFANSGLEATMYAVRLARAATGRDKVLKFEGHFHGLHDGLLWDTDTAPRLGAIGPDGIVESVPGSAGIPDILGSLVVTVPFNDVDAFDFAIRQHGSSIAAVILEPISLNVGCIPPDPGFLEHLREVTEREGIVLIFDEVLTGFRVALGGAQAMSGVTPDLTCLSKAFSGGMPVAALVGRADLMALLTPSGDCEMSGTNTARHFAVLGTLANLAALQRPGTYDRLQTLNDALTTGLSEIFDRRGVPAKVLGYGGRIGIYLGMEKQPRSLRDIVDQWDREYHMACYRAIADSGLYGFFLPLSCAPEAVTLCLAHTEADIAETLDRVDSVVASLPYRRNVSMIS